jgi:hypothetical protein
MLVQDFIKTFTEKKIVNSKIHENAVSDYLKKELEIKTYIPFREKRKIAEMIVEKNIKVVDGIKKYDDIDGYVGLVVASIVAHTNLQFGDDVVADYDLLAESCLLTQIIAEFQGSHEEIGILLKMAVASELEDNNINVIIAHFLDGILKKLDAFKGFDVKDLLGNIGEEDLAKLIGLLDKIK